MKLTPIEWDAIIDAFNDSRESMEDDGDECFLPWLAALDSAEQKIRDALL